MEPSSQSTNSIGSQVAADTSLRRYLVSLDQSAEGYQLLNHIRLYARKAGLEGELTGRELALEIFNEVVVEALRHEERFDDARSPRPWLWGIAVNVIKRRREKLFRQRQHETVASDLAIPLRGVGEINEEELFDCLVAFSQANPEQVVIGAMGIEEMLSPLSSEDRRLIELNILHEMNGAEVAQVLGISPGNARVRLSRALSRLRTLLMNKEAGREEKYHHE